MKAAEHREQARRFGQDAAAAARLSAPTDPEQAKLYTAFVAIMAEKAAHHARKATAPGHAISQEQWEEARRNDVSYTDPFTTTMDGEL